MTAKLKFKITTDILLTVLLPVLMAYALTGQKVHEWIGAVMFAAFILHNGLNANWYLNLFRGKYTPQRILQTAINLMVFASMIGLMISGIIMSRYVFSFLPINGSASFARELHMLSAYWGFVLMSLHLGMHGNMIKGIANKSSGIRSGSRPYKAVLPLIAIIIAAYGLYAFLKNDIASYMFLKNMFVFFDPDQPAILFFAEYLAMMMLFACVAYYVSMLLQIYTRKKHQKRYK
ncbi:hypothetical protein CDLVIII_0905 [Clostridium sp. DL-VIII]|uniref:DUF4405 domain-containing protein n=1 Tax=Clostridium sp. DL-VIII TaxID=641107 RepID=UPI00023AF1AA|nr:DUF4405 domain-containing protein [Clostridium sp. DL-VIII]EHI97621.1 hypothetical protein CDLVIII_0905 [Clostridium sp. DL-VIII]